MDDRVREVLDELYRPGSGQASVRNWPAVVRALRRADPGGSDAEALAAGGLGFEALLLGNGPSPSPGGLLTAVEPELGALWPLAGRVARGLAASPVEISLDAPLLPPCVWVDGGPPQQRRPTLAGIGCRAPSPEARAFAVAVGEQIAGANGMLVSGGAIGSDEAFATGHGAAVAVLPHGLECRRTLPGVAARVSASAPEAGFSRERAMRRNALIVAAADLTLVASARLREGGSWHAAMGALRRRAPLAVYVGNGAGEGARALAALGALPVRDADEAVAALDLVRHARRDDDLPALWAGLSGVSDRRVQPALAMAYDRGPSQTMA